jgi:cell division protein FtsN
MARDYARGPARPPQRGKKPAARGGARGGSGSRAVLWVGLFVGLSIGLVVAAFVYISTRPTLHGPAGVAAAGGATNPEAAGAANPAPASKAEVARPIAPPPKQPSRFAFYELLPSYEVVIPREDAQAAKAGKPTTPALKDVLAAPGQYLIQVGAYKTREEADRGRASLALLGVESRIEQVTIDQTETWYRVRIGPEDSLSKAQEIVERLENNGIKTMLVKVKAG